jgi:hypothetical protein
MRSSAILKQLYRQEIQLISEIRPEQLQEIQRIAKRFENLRCVECAQAIQSYLRSEGIPGKRIKLYTGSLKKPNNFIYDDSVPGEAISYNGRHEGILVIIHSQEIIFDNHHPEGIPTTQWFANLQFHNRVMLGHEFQITEEEF